MSEEFFENIEDARIVEKVITEIKDDIVEILSDYHLARKTSIDVANLNEKSSSEIIDLFAKIINRIGKFTDYKSRIKILSKDDKLSDKELSRCVFILRVLSESTIKIIKDDINKLDGKFLKAVRRVSKRRRRRPGTRKQSRK